MSDPKTREQIREALSAPGMPGVREIAEQFGVNASTAQHISSGPLINTGPGTPPKKSPEHVGAGVLQPR
jgi:hypothetical protein